MQLSWEIKKKKKTSVPNFSTSFSGSTPGDKIKNTGQDGLLSSYSFSNSILVPSTYLDPMLSSAKALAKTFTKKLDDTQHARTRQPRTNRVLTSASRSSCQAEELEGLEASGKNFCSSNREAVSRAPEKSTRQSFASVWASSRCPGPAPQSARA